MLNPPEPVCSIAIYMRSFSSMNKKFAVLCALNLISLSASADPDHIIQIQRHEHDRGTTCLSVSKSLMFIAQDPFDVVAKTKAIQACQASPQTSNAECASNVMCEPTTPSWRRAECTTSSKSLPFTVSGNDELQVKVQVVQQCQANPTTDNSECFNNAACQTMEFNPDSAFSCVSTSQSQLFTSTDSDPAMAKQNAIRACQANPQTNNAECMNTATCEEVSANYIPLAACTTSSRSIPFIQEERKYKNEVLADVVRACQANPQTNNAECLSNVQCEVRY